MRRPAGLTMIELLVVVVIIATLFLILMMGLGNNLFRAHDAERKADLEKIQVALEDYYNDEGCYPPADVLDACGEGVLDPYMDRVPCDPTDGEPYLYVPLDDACSGYRLYAELADDTDRDIAALGCDNECGCGYGASYNYGVSAGVPVTTASCLANTLPSPSPEGSADPTQSPTASSSPEDNNVYACNSSGFCNQYSEGSPLLEGCTTYQEANLCLEAVANNSGCPNPCEAG
jgi:prepilin-type N-terminal cleavage/methylation domain-containing protein